jgi:hypothetical protein
MYSRFGYVNPQNKPPFRTNEYTFHIRSDESDDHNPNDNEVTLQLNTGSGTEHIEMISLCSAEIPLSQYIVEVNQNQIYYSEGIRFDEGDAHRRFVVEVDGGAQEFEVVLPLYLNKIVRVDVGADVTSVIFTTEFEHGLELADCWTTWGECIRVIGTFFGDIPDLRLKSSNVSFTVLNETQFLISPLYGTIAWAAPGGFLEGDIGYVWAPGIPDGHHLADILNKAFALEGLTNFHIRYQASTGQFVIRTSHTLQPVLLAPDQAAVGDTHLALTLGFFHGCSTTSNGGRAVPTSVADPSPAPAAMTATLTSGTPDVREFQLCIEPGNYSAGSFANEFNFRMQRFYWEPGCSEEGICPPPPNAVFTFSDAMGVCHQITIPYGKWRPEQLADFLQEEMNSTDPAEPYRVHWNRETQKFTFRTVNGCQFGLEFGCPDPGDSSQDGSLSIANRLGFLPLPHRGLSEYCSDLCCPYCSLLDAMTSDLSSYIYTMIPLGAQKRLSILISKIKPFPAVLNLNMAGTLATITSDPQLAHGLHVGDVINVLVNDQRFLLPVVEVPDAFSVVVETLTAFEVFVPGMDEPVVVSLAGETVPTFLFHDRTAHSAGSRCSINPTLLGFPQETTRFDVNSCSSTVIAPHECDFKPPEYLLMEMVAPTLSGRITHTSGGATHSSILAKIILFPEIRMERLYPMNQDALGCTQGSRVTLRLVNPDHSPYQLHGKTWSATLCLRISEPGASVPCT